MKENGHGSKLLVGKKAIKEYLDLNSDELLRKWMEKGLPILIEDNRYYAHMDNLNDWLRAATNVYTKEIPEGTE